MDLVKCAFCKAMVPESQFCPACGKRQRKWCPKCAEDGDDHGWKSATYESWDPSGPREFEAEFCPDCGTALQTKSAPRE
jgi:rRNA maturation endonuclease Nob1